MARGNITIHFNGNLPFADQHPDGTVEGSGIYQQDWQRQFADVNNLEARGGMFGTFAMFRCADRTKRREIAAELVHKLPAGCDVRSGDYPYRSLL